MKPDWPTKDSKMFRILQVISELSTQCHEGRVPVIEIRAKFGDRGSESTRVMLSELKRNGFVETPMRGMYILTEKGISRLMN